MPGKTAIDWATHSWNPVTGCDKVSPGCAHCYAETFAERWRGTPGHPYEQGFDLKLWPERLDVPLRWKKPAMIFVNSMSDLFHDDVPDEFIAEVFARMAVSQHTFQVLTKRPERMHDLLKSYRFFKLTYRAIMRLGTGPSAIPNTFIMADVLDEEGFGALNNVWLGVSIENRRFVGRADVLRATPAAVRFISAEPLLGPLFEPYDGWEDDYAGHGLFLRDIDWLIVGGESGAHHRAMRPNWARDLRDAAITTGTAFFFKQWGGRTPKAGGRMLDGRTWDEMPERTGVVA